MKWFCITLACLGLTGRLIVGTPVSPTDSISETVLLKKEVPQSSNIPGVDIMLKFATAFSGALTEVFQGKDKEVIAYTKQIKEIGDKLPVGSLPIRPDSFPIRPDSFPIRPDSLPIRPDSLPIRPDSFPIRVDSIPEQVAAHTKQVQDAVDKVSAGSIPSKEALKLIPADLAPKPNDAPDGLPKQPENADPSPEATKTENRKRRSASPIDSKIGDWGSILDTAPIRSVLEKFVPPKSVPKEPEQPEEPSPEVKESDRRKRRSASPIDTKIAGGPRIEDRYLIEASSVETSSGKFVEQPKGLITTCPNHDGGPVIIMIKKVNKLSFDTADSENEDSD